MMRFPISDILDEQKCYNFLTRVLRLIKCIPIVLLFIFVFILASCTYSQPPFRQTHITVTPPPLPFEVHPEPNLKLGILEVDKDETQKPFRFRVVILVDNRTERTIFFDPNSGFKLFIYVVSKGKWEEIPNRVKYVSHGSEERAGEILVPKGQGLNFVTVHHVVPEIPSDLPGPYILRILVRGEVLQDGRPMSETIENYIDVFLH